MSLVYDKGAGGQCFSLTEVYDAFYFFMRQNPPGALVQKVIEYNYGPLELEVIAMALRDGLDIESYCSNDTSYVQLSDYRLKLRGSSGPGVV